MNASVRAPWVASATVPLAREAGTKALERSSREQLDGGPAFTPARRAAAAGPRALHAEIASSAEKNPHSPSRRKCRCTPSNTPRSRQRFPASRRWRAARLFENVSHGQARSVDIEGLPRFERIH